MMSAVSVLLLVFSSVSSSSTIVSPALAQEENLTEKFLQENPDFDLGTTGMEKDGMDKLMSEPEQYLQ